MYLYLKSSRKSYFISICDTIVVLRICGIIITNQERQKNERISESMNLDIRQGNLRNEISQIIEEGKKLESITYVSENNNEIYSRNSSKIIGFIKK